MRLIMTIAIVGVLVIAGLLWRLRGEANLKDRDARMASSVPADPNFQQWIAKEASQADQQHLSQAARKAEVARVLATLTPEQADQLQLAAEDQSADTSKRFVAVYLMVEAGKKSLPQLLNFLSKSSPKVEEKKGLHSQTEIKTVQERSLKQLAVEGALSELKADPSLKSTMLKAFQLIPDLSLRAYAVKTAGG